MVFSDIFAFDSSLQIYVLSFRKSVGAGQMDVTYQVQQVSTWKIFGYSHTMYYLQSIV